MPVKVIGANGVGSAADIAEGIVWAADHGARVINMSFVLTGPDDNVAAAIAYAQARGALSSRRPGTSAPRTSPTLRPIPASSASPGRIRPTSDMQWSSYGGWVRLAAPGCSVATGAGGSYADFCGTSSATALVAGLAGLMGPRSLADPTRSGRPSRRTPSESETSSRRGGSTSKRPLASLTPERAPYLRRSRRPRPARRS